MTGRATADRPAWQAAASPTALPMSGLGELTPWGFELSDIAVPVLLIHGRQDVNVPVGHGEWLAGHIPGVEARFFDDEGHLSLSPNRTAEVHAWLSERR